MFQDSVVVSSLMVEMSTASLFGSWRWDYNTVENVGHQSPSDTVPYPGRTEISAALFWEPKDVHRFGWFSVNLDLCYQICSAPVPAPSPSVSWCLIRWSSYTCHGNWTVTLDSHDSCRLSVVVYDIFFCERDVLYSHFCSLTFIFQCCKSGAVILGTGGNKLWDK